MMSSVNGVVWTGGGGGGMEEDAVSWTRNSEKQEEMGLSTFKPVPEEDWYLNTCTNPPHHDFQTIQTHQEIKDSAFSTDPNGENLFLQPLDSSSSSSPSSVFNLDPSSLLPSKNCLSSLLNVVCTSPFDTGFDLGCDALFLPPARCGILPGFGGLGSNGDMGAPDLTSESQFPNTHLPPLPENTSFGGFEGSSGNALFMNRPKALRPLEVLPPVGAQPTLFQKRAALRQNSAPPEKTENLRCLGMKVEESEKRKMRIEADELEELSIDGSGFNCDSDDATDNQNNEGEENHVNNNNSNASSAMAGGNQKGKKKGLPAKNLMAERRRRQKLNDRLYMLRSVVPKISKMDRASILGDAIEYLKELLQRINDLHNELESTPSSSALPPLTPTLPTLPCRVKEELCPSSLPSPNGQPARVEVRVREGRAVNIHMLCSRRPGLLLSVMRALDGLGLDVQQAVISCFNGFALDVFRAEQCREGPDVPPEDIKAVLLHSAGFLGIM